MKYAFKHANNPYQAFQRPDSGLTSKSMTGRRPNLDLQKNW